jgi:hypothetical protein
MTERPRYYYVRNGWGYWQPTKRMRDLGLEAARCGPDGPAAWAIAEARNAEWDIKRGTRPASSSTAKRAGLTDEDAELVRASAVLLGVRKQAQSFAPRSKAASELAKGLQRLANTISREGRGRRVGDQIFKLGMANGNQHAHSDL